MRIVSSRAQALRQSSVKEIALRLIDGRQQKTDDAGGLQSAQSRIPGRFGLVGWKLGLINSISVRSPRTRLGWAILCGTDAVDHEEIAIALTTTIEANLKCSEGVVSRSPEKTNAFAIPSYQAIVEPEACGARYKAAAAAPVLGPLRDPEEGPSCFLPS
ncbi:hypothetical protein AXG93_638s1120 [Marchantia polymorpha subsp. ruderalis]|uniref:Uncharacterized protein n=1 Tax=Marchantia polymorpha subsp. ruderalis TaxID=1480154 RepID=A0A176W515_MARPO|nr:hypothetical protein AXG93_638s1120 [Marchantia polymorpha subsp. ruderalis]